MNMGGCIFLSYFFFGLLQLKPQNPMQRFCLCLDTNAVYSLEEMEKLVKALFRSCKRTLYSSVISPVLSLAACT